MPSHFCRFKLSALLIFSAALALFGESRTKSGALTVISTPTEAKVWIDGNFEGVTPLKNKVLSAGSHTVRVLDEITQISQTKTVQIVKDSTSILDVALERDFGGISVITKPEGAQVVFATNIGKTPIKEDKIIPGAYTVKIEVPGSKRYGTLEKEVIITPNSTVEINESLPKKKRHTVGQIILRSALAGAAGGCYAWGFNALYYDYDGVVKNGKNFKDFKNGDLGFWLGTGALVGLATVSIFF